MKTKVFYLLWGLMAFVFFSCADEYAKTQSNNGIEGSLTYTWSSSQDGDTTILSCNQVLRYEDTNGNWKTINPVATVKIVPTLSSVEYAEGKDPTPIYLRSVTKNGYEGTNPRYRVITQQLFFDDGQVLDAKLSMPIYSYFNSSGREQFYPYIQFQELMFSSVTMREVNGVVYPTISLSLPWLTSNNDENGTQTINVSYAKTKSDNVDKLINTTYSQGVDWTSQTTFNLYVERTETWMRAGKKTTRKPSPDLSFSFTATGNRSLDVTNFDFVGTLRSDASIKQDISRDGWTLKKGTATQTVSFSNGAQYFDDVFSYPLYEASVTFDGRTFDFDLSVDFKENYQVSILSDKQAKNTTVATATFAQKSFDKTILTSFNKVSTPEPPKTSKYGKVLDVKVTAVFDQASITNNSGHITKKCVLVRYEQGYEWGICDYNVSFPSSFTYTKSTYTGFDSAAKKTANDSFQLARSQPSDSKILWYDENSKLISGIDALTCKIYGWENIVNGIYAATVNGYSVQYGSDSYTVTVKAPDGMIKTFSSY